MSLDAVIQVHTHTLTSCHSDRGSHTITLLCLMYPDILFPSLFFVKENAGCDPLNLFQTPLVGHNIYIENHTLK